mgnify:CR=1 FL=1
MNFTKGLLVLTVLFIATLVFGTVGFMQHDARQGFPTALYKAIQLFSLESGVVDPPTPGALEIGRWLGLLTTLTGFVGAVAAAFHGFRAALGIRLSGGHDIVCGAGEKGCAIAESILASGGKVAVIESDESAPSIAQLRTKGAMVLLGDARELPILKKAGLVKASHLVCATGDDNANLAIAMTATGSPLAALGLKVHVHIADVAHSDILVRNGILGGTGNQGPNLCSFNFFRNRARSILRDFPLECDNHGQLSDGVLLVLPTLDPLGAALVLQVALIGHYRVCAKVGIHLVGRNAERELQQLLSHVPNFRECADITAHAIAEDNEFSTCAARVIAGERSKASAFSTVFLGSLEENAALAEALLLKERSKGSDRFRVLISARDDSALRQIVGGQTGQDGAPLSRWIKFLPPAHAACGCDSVYAETLDEVARAVHDKWYAGNSAAIDKAEQSADAAKVAQLRGKPAYKPWGELTEEQKSDNRSAADHLAVKIRAAGLDPDDRDLERKWASLDTPTLDMLSRVEHQRWSAVKWLGGWQLGVRCNEQKIHDNLVPFDDLDDATKNYDLEQVKSTVASLRGARRRE